MSAGDFDDIIQQLRDVEETLAERAISVLREAIEAGSTSKPAAEKAITQARRSVEKAIRLLDGADVTSD